MSRDDSAITMHHSCLISIRAESYLWWYDIDLLIVVFVAGLQYEELYTIRNRVQITKFIAINQLNVLFITSCIF